MGDEYEVDMGYDEMYGKNSSVRIELIEGFSNSVTKHTEFNEEYLYLHDVLRTMEEALRGLGFATENKELRLVDVGK